MCYGGTWYEVKPVNRTPKCTCGLDATLASNSGAKAAAVLAAARAERDEARDEAGVLRLALEKIATMHHDYGSGEGGQYGIGVVDGHRCAGDVARAALASGSGAKAGVLRGCVQELKDCLLWCSGSAVFGPDGEAWEGWKKGPRQAIIRADAALDKGTT